MSINKDVFAITRADVVQYVDPGTHESAGVALAARSRRDASLDVERLLLRSARS